MRQIAKEDESGCAKLKTTASGIIASTKFLGVCCSRQYEAHSVGRMICDKGILPYCKFHWNPEIERHKYELVFCKYECSKLVGDGQVTSYTEFKMVGRLLT